jgi:phage terminase small subunit
MSAPEHLSKESQKIWLQIAEHRADLGLAPLRPTVLEAVAVITSRMRDASARIDEEGLLVSDAKGNPIPHPAIEIERLAAEQLRKLTA